MKFDSEAAPPVAPCRNLSAPKGGNLSGGNLTPQEHRQVEHQQNAESRQIYREKHDARTEEHPHGEGRR